MCTFQFLYADGRTIKCEHIKSAAYSSAKGRIDVREQDLPVHPFPTGKSLWLFSENGSFCICHDGLQCIEVNAE